MIVFVDSTDGVGLMLLTANTNRDSGMSPSYSPDGIPAPVGNGSDFAYASGSDFAYASGSEHHLLNSSSRSPVLNLKSA